VSEAEPSRWEAARKILRSRTRRAAPLCRCKVPSINRILKCTSLSWNF